MDSTRQEQEHPQSLSTCSSGRKSYDSQNSPDFEFWMVTNPSAPQQDLISADDIFVNGVLLPLDLLSLYQKEEEKEEERQTDSCPGPESGQQPGQDIDPGLELSSITTTETTPLLTASKRWKDIFKKSDKKSTTQHDKNNEKDKRKEKKSQIGLSSAELNINIWPFSRSRSAGNNGTRPRTTVSRKVSSAPCSRSNSSGESKSRKWPSSPSRPGVHLARTSPVWQVRRGGTSRQKNSAEAVAAKTIKKKTGKVLNLKVPMCIGYKHQLSCRSDENSALGGCVGSNGGESGGNSFSIRSIFTKKVY